MTELKVIAGTDCDLEPEPSMKQGISESVTDRIGSTIAEELGRLLEGVPESQHAVLAAGLGEWVRLAGAGLTKIAEYYEIECRTAGQHTVH